MSMSCRRVTRSPTINKAQHFSGSTQGKLAPSLMAEGRRSWSVACGSFLHSLQGSLLLRLPAPSTGDFQGPRGLDAPPTGVVAGMMRLGEITMWGKKLFKKKRMWPVTRLLQPRTRPRGGGPAAKSHWCPGPCTSVVDTPLTRPWVLWSAQKHV